MKLASLKSGYSGGQLTVVSRDMQTAVRASAASTMQDLLDDWEALAPQLQKQYESLNKKEAHEAFALIASDLLAALPRSYQFLDGSAFLSHNHILADAWGYERRSESAPPLMYQGLSDKFYAPNEDVPFKSEVDLIDFEAEFAIIVDHVPLGLPSSEAGRHIRLITIINDWSLRAFGPQEMKGGFGFIHAKPPSTMAGIAITPDELGMAWRAGRIHLPLQVYWNDRLFGKPNGNEMNIPFPMLIAHAAATRDLCAATVIGAGTVSNENARLVGSACIAERAALEKLNPVPEPVSYLKFGDKVRLEVVDEHGQALFGTIEQRVVERDLAR